MTFVRALVIAVALSGLSGPASAAPGPENAAVADRRSSNLLPKLAAFAARFETALARSRFFVEAHMVLTNDEGRVENVQHGSFRVDARGARARWDVLSYLEDGRDRTVAMRRRFEARQRKAAARLASDEALHLPFLLGEQPKYVFRVGETSPTNPALVRVYFNARKPAKNLGNGSAWVDVATGNIVSLHAKQSRPPLFVESFEATVDFGATTALGAAASHVSFDVKLGVAWVRKHFRGSADLSRYETF